MVFLKLAITEGFFEPLGGKTQGNNAPCQFTDKVNQKLSPAQVL